MAAGANPHLFSPPPHLGAPPVTADADLATFRARRCSSTRWSTADDVMTTALVRHTDDPRRAEWQDGTAYEAALGANEEFAEWHRVLEPISPVLPMGTVRNRMTALVVDDRPLVLGLHQVGDALTTTNPSRGRGISFGLAAASRLLDTVADGSTDPEAAVLSMHAWQQDVLAHYWRETCIVDLETSGRIRAHLTGGGAPAAAPDVLLPEGHPVSSAEIAEAAFLDADLFRVFIRALHMMDDDREIGSAATVERVRQVLTGRGVPTAPALDEPDALPEPQSPSA